jgi:hypothetical protein
MQIVFMYIGSSPYRVGKLKTSPHLPGCWRWFTMVIKAMLRGLLTIEELNLLFLQVKGTLRRASHALDMPIGLDCDGIQPTRLGEEPVYIGLVISFGLLSFHLVQ